MIFQQTQAVPLVPPFMGGTSSDICRYYCSAFRGNLVIAMSPFKSLGPISFLHIDRMPQPVTVPTFTLSIGEEYPKEVTQVNSPIAQTVSIQKYLRTDSMSEPFYDLKTISNVQSLAINSSGPTSNDQDTFTLNLNNDKINEANGSLTIRNLSAFTFSKTVTMPEWYGSQRIFCAISSGSELDFMKSIAKIIGANFVKTEARYIFAYDPGIIRQRFLKSISFFEPTGDTVEGAKNRIRMQFLNLASDSMIIENLNNKNYIKRFSISPDDPAYLDSMKLLQQMKIRLKIEKNTDLLSIFSQIPEKPLIEIQAVYNLATSVLVTMQDGSKLAI